MTGAGASTPGGSTPRPVRPRRARKAGPPAPRDAEAAPDDDAGRAKLGELAALGALASELAHEVRNPLVALKSFLELLPERPRDPEVEARFLSVARDELRRAERLLDAMVLPRREGARDEAPGEVAGAVHAVATLLGPRARRRGASIEARVGAGLPPAALGSDALRQVLLNLALNAVDASPPGGRVRVAARAARGGIELSVRDDGPGLPAAPDERGPYGLPTAPDERGPYGLPTAPDERGPAPKASGGLGLGITRRLLEAAGGRLAAGRAPGGGAELRAWLPFARPARPGA
jgi:signal transduction histidine kinase